MKLTLLHPRRATVRYNTKSGTDPKMPETVDHLNWFLLNKQTKPQVCFESFRFQKTPPLVSARVSLF